MRRFSFYIVVCVCLCACSAKKKVTTSDTTDKHTEKTELTKKTDSEIIAEVKNGTTTTIAEDEEVIIEHIIYRKDTLLPAEVVKVHKLKTKKVSQQVIDSAAVLIHSNSDSIVHHEKIDSLTAKKTAEKVSKTSRPFNITVMIVLIVVVILGGLYFIGHRKRAK